MAGDLRRAKDWMGYTNFMRTDGNPGFLVHLDLLRMCKLQIPLRVAYSWFESMPGSQPFRLNNLHRQMEARTDVRPNIGTKQAPTGGTLPRMRATTDVILYNRHSKTCPVLKMPDLAEDAKRYYMECDCPIRVVGRTPEGNLVPRQTTGTKTLEEAEAQVRAILAKSKTITKEEAVKKQTDAITGPTVRECAERYLESRRHELSDKTIGQHELLLNRLVDYYCSGRGVQCARNLTVDLLETLALRENSEKPPIGIRSDPRADDLPAIGIALRDYVMRVKGGWV
jgi:hypothetical protein